MRCGLAALFVVALSASLVRAAEPAKSTLRVCVDQFLSTVVRDERAVVLKRWPATFMLPGDVKVESVHFEETDCRGFLAVGARFTQDIELRVQSNEGQMLAQAEGPSTTPYAFHCGRAGETVFVTLRMLDGQGEVELAVLSHFELDARNRKRITSCAGVGAPRPRVLDLGMEPQASTIEQEQIRVTQELGVLGYERERIVAYGTLAPEQHAAHALMLEPDRCYALVALGSRDIFDLDLRVFAPSLSMRPVAEDTTRRRSSVVKMCSERSRNFVMDVALYQGQGAYTVQLFRLDEPTRPPAGVTGEGRISLAELQRRMHDRGFTPSIASSGMLRDGDSLTLPFMLQAGRCYAFAAVGTHGFPTGRLALTLLNDQHEVIALDAPNRRDPLLFSCPTRDEPVQVIVQSKGARIGARFLLLFATDATRDEPLKQ